MGHGGPNIQYYLTDWQLLVTDHASLQWMARAKDTNPRLPCGFLLKAGLLILDAAPFIKAQTTLFFSNSPLQGVAVMAGLQPASLYICLLVSQWRK